MKKKPSTPILAAIFFGLLIIFGALFFKLNMKPTEMKYTEFIQQLEDGKVESARLSTKGGLVSFKLKDDKTEYTTNYPYTDDFVEKLLLNDVELEVYEKKSITEYAYLMMILLLFGTIFLTSRNMGNGLSASSRQNPEKSKTKFSDIAGLEEIKEEMKDLISLLENNKGKDNGIRLPHGILFEGPPGNGKTLLAKAIAGETGVNFFAINASDFSSPFVGMSSMKINRLFKDAKREAPSIIFIDELDAIGSKRTTAGTSTDKEMNSTLTTILNQMDGFESLDNVIVIAATNMASALDPALVRPGRFDRKYTINNPDKKSREELFELYTKKKKLAEDVDIPALIRKTYGFSCSEIENLINEAGIISLKGKRESISNADFDEAMVHILMNGSSKKNYEKNERIRKITAYHEAGHAMIAHLSGKTVNTVSIIPVTSGAGGYTMSERNEDGLMTLEEYRQEIMGLYGGRAAETILGHNKTSNSSNGCSNDIKVATELINQYIAFRDGLDYSVFGNHGIENLLEESKTVSKELFEKTRHKLQENWQAVEAVANALLEKETLDTEEFLSIAKPYECELFKH